jgi:hypothetical protein
MFVVVIMFVKMSKGDEDQERERRNYFWNWNCASFRGLRNSLNNFLSLSMLLHRGHSCLCTE